MSQANPDRSIPIPTGRGDPAMYAEMCVRRRLNELDKRLRVIRDTCGSQSLLESKCQAWEIERDMLSEWLAERR